MNSLDVGTCLFTSDGETLFCGDVSRPVASFAIVDDRVQIDLPGVSVCLLAEEWFSLVGTPAPVVAEVTQEVEVAPKKRGRRS